jgi:hypothetical protein
MTKRTPPVPPAGRSNKGPGSDHADLGDAKVRGEDDRTRNLKEQGRQGNIAQNTRNQGYQQDR